MIVYKQGEQVVLTAKARKDVGWRRFFHEMNMPLDYIFTIHSESNTNICQQHGGMSHLLSPRIYDKHPWNIYTDDLEYAYKVVDLDEDDADCI